MTKRNSPVRWMLPCISLDNPNTRVRFSVPPRKDVVRMRTMRKLRKIPRGIKESGGEVQWVYRVDVRHILRAVGDEVYVEDAQHPYVRYDAAKRERYIQCASCETRFYDGQWVVAEELMRICRVCGRTFCHKCAYEIELWDEMQICKECLNERDN